MNTLLACSVPVLATSLGYALVQAHRNTVAIQGPVAVWLVGVGLFLGGVFRTAGPTSDGGPLLTGYVVLAGTVLVATAAGILVTSGLVLYRRPVDRIYFQRPDTATTGEAAPTEPENATDDGQSLEVTYEADDGTPEQKPQRP